MFEYFESLFNRNNKEKLEYTPAERMGISEQGLAHKSLAR